MTHANPRPAPVARPGRRGPAARALLALAVVALASQGAAFARGYMTPGFRARQSRPMRVAILPPHAEFIKEKVLMTDQMLSESAALEREAAAALKTRLEELGYTVRLVSESEMAKNPRLKQLIVRVNDRYGEEWSKMVYRPRLVRDKRYTCGEDVVRLASFLKVDGLAVARIVANGRTKGKVAFSAVFGTPTASSYARLDLAVLNGREGLVEAFFIGLEYTSLGQLTKKPAHIMGQVAEKVLNRYPLAGAAEVLDEEEIAAAASGGGSKDAGDDEAAIKDFEMLLHKKESPPSGARDSGQ